MKAIAREFVKAVRVSVTIDWTVQAPSGHRFASIGSASCGSKNVAVRGSPGSRGRDPNVHRCQIADGPCTLMRGRATSRSCCELVRSPAPRRLPCWLCARLEIRDISVAKGPQVSYTCRWNPIRAPHVDRCDFFLREPGADDRVRWRGEWRVAGHGATGGISELPLMPSASSIDPNE